MAVAKVLSPAKQGSKTMFEAETLMERNRVETHVGRLSHLTTDADSDTDMARGGLLQAFSNLSRERPSKEVLYKTSSNI